MEWPLKDILSTAESIHGQYTNYMPNCVYGGIGNQMAVLFGMPQYSIRLEAAICAQFVYFLHSKSVTCLRLGDVSVICRVTYFHYPIQFCFSSMSVLQAAQRRLYAISYIYDVAEILGRYLSCTRRRDQENDFELILTVKMETRHEEKVILVVSFGRSI